VTSNIYWIEHAGHPRLAIMARPRSGDWLDDEVDSWRAAGVQVVVSLLEREEEIELGLQSEAAACAAQSIAFVRFPIPDRGVPADPGAARKLARELAASDAATAIHCRAGIGRSSVIAALVLNQRGLDAETAFERITAARGLRVPDTEAQRLWVMALAAGGGG
jgi:protein-tyrosine phosphatase